MLRAPRSLAQDQDVACYPVSPRRQTSVLIADERLSDRDAP